MFSGRLSASGRPFGTPVAQLGESFGPSGRTTLLLLSVVSGVFCREIRYNYGHGEDSGPSPAFGFPSWNRAGSNPFLDGCVSKMNGTIEQLQTRASDASLFTAWSDEKLLAAYRTTSDRAAFEELVRRYERELFSYLRHYMGDAEMAEDVFQQTFLQVHLKCDQFEPGRKVRPWLYTVATNQAIDHKRRNRRHQMVSLDRSAGSDGEEDAGSLGQLLDAAGPSPAEESESAERYEGVRHAVEELPEPVRQVVVLVYFQGLKYREAADVLDIPVGTVKSRLHAAIGKLSEALSRTHLPK